MFQNSISAVLQKFWGKLAKPKVKIFCRRMPRRQIRTASTIKGLVGYRRPQALMSPGLRATFFFLYIPYFCFYVRWCMNYIKGLLYCCWIQARNIYIPHDFASVKSFLATLKKKKIGFFSFNALLLTFCFNSGW
jgi:hypothetical protein